jgi:hypothetical protein
MGVLFVGDLVKPRTHTVGGDGRGDGFGFGWKAGHQLFHQDLRGALFVPQRIEFNVHALRVPFDQQISGEGITNDVRKIRPAGLGMRDECSMEMGCEAESVSCHVSIKAAQPGGQKVLKRDARRNVSR